MCFSFQYYANGNKIHDFPRFHHRGFLIDTSRHFVDVVVIEQFIVRYIFTLSPEITCCLNFFHGQNNERCPVYNFY